MTNDPATPDTITLQRRLPVKPARVFKAWSNREERMKWDFPGDDWVIADIEQDFREDGIERTRFGPKDNPDIQAFGRYQIIEPDRRIVSAGTMRSLSEGPPSSATLMTLDLVADGEGTLLTLIDQSVYLGRGETAEMRESGWGTILDRLEKHLNS